MSSVYERTDAGSIPVDLKAAKAHLKLETSADDDLLTDLLEVAADFVEEYVGRDYRANTWELRLDVFCDRIFLRRDPVASITSIKYQDEDDVEQTVATSVYYLKKGASSSEILLQPDQEWPSDVHEREQSILVTFETEAHRSLGRARAAILRLVAFLYENRGDCDPLDGGGSMRTALTGSGAAALLDQVRVSRV